MNEWNMKNSIPALRVRQWLPEWDQVNTNPAKYQSTPPREFFVASVRAKDLRALSDVHRRNPDVDKSRSEDPYIQRGLEQDRTNELSRYIRLGYPLSSLGARPLPDEERQSLRKPGWLPTAIIANILNAGEMRNGLQIDDKDLVSVMDSAGVDAHTKIQLPSSWTQSGWEPTGAAPVEIIDGQHRLSAFDADVDGDYELPVVFFNGLDFSWQAYIFWTVNIKPKKINASLAYDLYPLLREQDWLEAGEALQVYRDTRAQELVEMLWSDDRSIWRDRINMLGRAGMRETHPVTQSAFLRSLTASFVRPFKGYKHLGGLFGGAADNTGFGWPRGQQGAFLVFAWARLGEAILGDRTSEWSKAIRHEGDEPLFDVDLSSPTIDPAIVGPYSLLASDQGVRAFHMTLNDIFYMGRVDLGVDDWTIDGSRHESTETDFDISYKSLEGARLGESITALASSLASFDWRNSRAPGLNYEEKEFRQALRGSGGYSVLRTRLLVHVVSSARSDVADAADQVLEALRHVG